MARKTTDGKGTQTTQASGRTRPVRAGFISHTELASMDPAATRKWCEKALGWTFGDAMPTPQGPYEMWNFGDDMGGGIRRIDASETPGTIAYCEVPDIKAAYKTAIKAGGKEVLPPTEIPGNNGWTAIVQAPGGVPIGFWAQR